MDLEELGITKNELVERVIERCCDRILLEHRVNSDGDNWDYDSPIAVSLKKIFQAHVDAALAEVVDKYILPKAAQYIENVTLQMTNKWGEKRGEPLTFLEYLTQRAEAYLTEEVDYNGKTRGQDSCGWKADQTRIAFMVGKHLQYAIQTMMESAMKSANSAIVGGIEGAVKIKLAEVAEKLQVKVTTS